MRPSEALAKHREQVREIIARYPVTNPRIFGSTARGEDTEDSDLDILVDPEFGVTTFVHLGELEAELSQILGVGVDVVTPGGLLDTVAKRIRPELSAL